MGIESNDTADAVSEWRRGWDSNPRSLAAHALSRRARSAGLRNLSVEGVDITTPLNKRHYNMHQSGLWQL